MSDKNVNELLIDVAHIAYSHQSPHAASLHHHKSHLPVFQEYCNTSCMENGIKLFSVPSTFNSIFCFAMLSISPYLLFWQCGLDVDFRKNPEWQGSFNETIIGQQVSTLDTNVTYHVIIVSYQPDRYGSLGPWVLIVPVDWIDLTSKNILYSS